MNSQQAYSDFVKRLTHLIKKNPDLIKTTLSNIFTMRLIGNKTHGDLAEIGICEFINQFMYDYKSVHVGKQMYRAKQHEEDIKIINEINNTDFSVSLKAYGDGPLQLSTDKNCKMFPALKRFGKNIGAPQKIAEILGDDSFAELSNINVLPLIYRESAKQCNILVFDFEKAKASVALIKLEKVGKGRKHPVYRFYDKQGNYICEIRYGDAAANALQRGLWTNTKHGLNYFQSATGGWIDYSDNLVLVKLFSYALVATKNGHEKAASLLANDIEMQKRSSGI